MDEIQSDSHNNLIDHVNGEKKKKEKREKSETTDQQELTEDLNVQTEKRNDKTHERKNTLKESDSSLQTPTSKKEKRKLDEEGQASVSNILFVSSKTTPLKDFQREMDETQSDFNNDSIDHVIGEKRKKKKRREKSETTDQQEHTERSKVQTEKRHDETYDSKNTSKDSDSCLQTSTSKKKKRKLDKYETSIMDIGVVSSEASPLKDVQYEMDEIQSDSCNNLIDCVNGEKRKKKKKSKTTDQQELTEDSKVQTEKLHDETHERNNTSKELDNSLQTPTTKKKKRKLDKEGETSVTDVGVVSSEASPIKDFQCEMEEIQSDSQNTLIEHVNGEKRKKKKKRREKSEITDQQELTEDSKVQTEKRHDKMHKRKNTSKESDNSLHTLNVTSKKKKRKLNEGGETSMTDDGSNLQQVNNNKKNKLQEQQDSSEPTPSKKKKKRANATQTNYEDMAQESAMKTEHEEVPSTSEQEPAALVGTKRLKKNKNSLGENLVDAKLLNELREFFPKITSKNRSSHEINKMIRYDLPRFKEFKKQGIALRHGKYSDAENERLRRNVSDFLALTGVKDAVKLFHPKRYPEEMQALTKLKRNQKFFERIAEGIPRLCHDVFNRGTKVFDDRNNKGCFSKEEDKLLLKYYQLHGTNWKKISELTDRSAYSLEKRYAHIIVAKKSGAWSMKERQRLLRAVRDHIVSVLNSNSSENRAPKIVSREMLYQKLPWSNIAMKVKTRCWSKCREKWMAILTGRMSSGTTVRGRKAQEDKIRLMKVMYEIQVEDVADVNWEDVTAVFGDVPPAYAQSRWHQLKVSYVTDWKSKSFGDIVDFLYEKIMPELMKECKYLDNSECRVDQKQSFLLSDIFHDIEEDCSDSDEETGQKESISST